MADEQHVNVLYRHTQPSLIKRPTTWATPFGMQCCTAVSADIATAVVGQISPNGPITIGQEQGITRIIKRANAENDVVYRTNTCQTTEIKHGITKR